ncbi:UNKNOWN [Stylonychia lemnae]|uniref:Uncharacterized protein n=1 Tax=Stylonychia lemnae TaxID=5949 RepID=A0A078AFI4_STYLE|nr:UNKNOWN [Stylonychia lemnae]|eukprot:CDW81004.1 UNKNOWN [Stylonychia lemnae]
MEQRNSFIDQQSTTGNTAIREVLQEEECKPYIEWENKDQEMSTEPHFDEADLSTSQTIFEIPDMDHAQLENTTFKDEENTFNEEIQKFNNLAYDQRQTNQRVSHDRFIVFMALIQQIIQKTNNAVNIQTLTQELERLYEAAQEPFKNEDNGQWHHQDILDFCCQLLKAKLNDLNVWEQKNETQDVLNLRNPQPQDYQFESKKQFDQFLRNHSNRDNTERAQCPIPFKNQNTLQARNRVGNYGSYAYCTTRDTFKKYPP